VHGWPLWEVLTHMTPATTHALARARRRFPTMYELIRAIAATVGVRVEGDDSARAAPPPEPLQGMLARLAAIPGVRVVRGAPVPAPPPENKGD
jgi:hypothetical protein